MILLRRNVHDEIARLHLRGWWERREVINEKDEHVMISVFPKQKAAPLTIEPYPEKGFCARPTPITFANIIFRLIDYTNEMFQFIKPNYDSKNTMKSLTENLYSYDRSEGMGFTFGIENAYQFNDAFEFGEKKDDKLFDIYSYNGKLNSLAFGRIRKHIFDNFVYAAKMLIDNRYDWFDPSVELDTTIDQLLQLVLKLGDFDDRVFNDLNIICVDGFIMEGKTEYIAGKTNSENFFSSEPDAFYRTHFRGTWDGKKERLPIFFYKAFATFGYIASLLSEGQQGEKQDAVIYWDRSFLSHDTFEMLNIDFRSFFINLPSIYSSFVHMEIICLSHLKCEKKYRLDNTEYNIPYPFFERREMETELYDSHEELKKACSNFYDNYMGIAYIFWKKITTPLCSETYFIQEAGVSKVAIDVSNQTYLANQWWGDFPSNLGHAIYKKFDKETK